MDCKSNLRYTKAYNHATYDFDETKQNKKTLGN